MNNRRFVKNIFTKVRNKPIKTLTPSDMRDRMLRVSEEDILYHRVIETPVDLLIMENSVKGLAWYIAEKLGLIVVSIEIPDITEAEHKANLVQKLRVPENEAVFGYDARSMCVIGKDHALVPKRLKNTKSYYNNNNVWEIHEVNESVFVKDFNERPFFYSDSFDRQFCLFLDLEGLT